MSTVGPWQSPKPTLQSAPFPSLWRAGLSGQKARTPKRDPFQRLTLVPPNAIVQVSVAAVWVLEGIPNVSAKGTSPARSLMLFMTVSHLLSYLVLSNSNNLSLCFTAISRPDLSLAAWRGSKPLLMASKLPELSAPETQNKPQLSSQWVKAIWVGQAAEMTPKLNAIPGAKSTAL